MASAPPAGLVAITGLTLGAAAWSIDQLRRNDWNTNVILDGHAPLGDSLPAGGIAAGVGVGAGMLLARATSRAMQARITTSAGLLGIAGAVAGSAIGAATMLGPAIPSGRSHDASLWRQQVLGWAGPAFVAGSVAGGVMAVLGGAEGRALLRLARRG